MHPAAAMLPPRSSIMSGPLDQLEDLEDPLSDAQLQHALGADLQRDLDSYLELLPLPAPPPQHAAPAPAPSPVPPPQQPAASAADAAASLAFLQQVQQAAALQVLLGGQSGDQAALMLGLLSGSALQQQQEQRPQAITRCGPGVEALGSCIRRCSLSLELRCCPRWPRRVRLLRGCARTAQACETLKAVC
jgi:hypothetical protein